MKNDKHNKRILLLLVFFFICCSSLRTTSFQKYLQLKSQSPSPGGLDITTVCKPVILQQKYKYTGIVRSGYLSIGKGNSALSFIFYGKSSQTDIKKLSQYPTIIWLNGGPGFSSQLGNFYEVGPFTLKSIIFVKVEKNQFSWAENYNMLFIDQPVGTGLAYADTDFKSPFAKNLKDIVTDFEVGLKQLFQNPQGCFYQAKLNIPKSNPFYFAGNGYAGKYIPAIVQTLARQNGGWLGVKGVVLGNPFTQPLTIYEEIGNSAYELGLLDSKQKSRVQKMTLNAIEYNKLGNYKILHQIYDKTLAYIGQRSGINVWDITLDGNQYQNLVEEYLNDPAIITLYSIDPRVIYDSQSLDVFNNLYEDFMKSEKQRIQDLLTKSIPILIYNAQDDMTVQNAGTMKWVQALRYPDAEQFKSKLFEAWKINNVMAGSKKKAGSLQLRILNNAGFTAGLRRGRQMQNMINEFVESTLSQSSISKNDI